MGKPNGGYLAATMIRAAVTELELQGYDHPDCMAATSTYLGAPDPKEASIQVSVLRGGRGISQVRVVLEQDGVAMVESQLVLSKHKGQDRLYDSLPRPAATEPESCVRAVAGDGPQERRIAIMEGTEVLMDPATTVFDRGFDNGVAEIRGWASFADGRAIDGPALHYLIDCLPPATFVFQRAGWVPTLQLTGYLRSHPAPGPVLIRQRAQVIESGFVDEVCEIWDSDGRLVAQGTQLAKVRFA
jgi:acyl-CoA thioesterase